MLGSDPEFEKEKLVRPDLVFKDWVWIQSEHLDKDLIRTPDPDWLKLLGLWNNKLSQIGSHELPIKSRIK